MRHIGFTGTQRGLQEAQRVALLLFMKDQEGPITFHHGQCIGADYQAHAIAKGLGWRKAG